MSLKPNSAPKGVFPPHQATTIVTRTASKLLDNIADDKSYSDAVADWEKATFPVQVLFQPDEAGRGVKLDALLIVKERCTEAGLGAELQRVTEAVAKVTTAALKLCSPGDYNEMFEEEVCLVKHANELVHALDHLLEEAHRRNTDVSVLSSIIPRLVAVLEAQGIYDNCMRSRTYTPNRSRPAEQSSPAMPEPFAAADGAKA
jgi:hypothetical protein